MILVAGKPANLDLVQQEFLQPEVEKLQFDNESVEHQTLLLMQSNSEVYTYSKASELLLELAFRKAIVASSVALHNSALSFAIFHNTRCNQTYWERTSNGGFLLKPSANPATAVQDIYASGELYATECATGMMIVYYGALLAVFGEKNFSTAFPSIFLMNWQINDPLLSAAGTPLPQREVVFGDRLYFINPEVDPTTPHWQGENVILLPSDRYFGHGIGIGSSQDVIGILNRFRKTEAKKDAYLLDVIARPDFIKLANLRRDLS